MANIVELREMSNAKLEDLLEDAREEMFNLRFQQASARLENTARLKQVRRNIAQFQTVLHTRGLAEEAAIAEPAVAEALAGKEWDSDIRFVYEESLWQVEFSDNDGKNLATVYVDLNKKRLSSRRDRLTKAEPQLVQRFEVAG